MPLQATSGAASYDGFGGGVAAVPNYIEDVFSTYLYTGNSPSTQTITNGIDLSGKGGMVWVKSRVSGDGSNYNNILMDTARGTGSGNILYSNLTSAAQTAPNAGISSFNSNGFSLRYDDGYGTNYPSGGTFASWTFRKQPKFFDVVTGTGKGTFTHNLGVVPGCIILKRTSTTGNWIVAHNGLTGGITGTYVCLLNTTDAQSDQGVSLSPTATTFNPSAYVGTSDTWVAYFFASNAGGFGLTGTDNVISCGSVLGGAEANLGYEPQWVLAKASGLASNWFILDTMRGFTGDTVGSAQVLRPNESSAETTNDRGYITSTGFVIKEVNGQPYIYIAIRRGPMKVPTSGTSVFSSVTRTGTGANATISGVGFAPDVLLSADRNSAPQKAAFYDKLRGVGTQGGGAALLTSSTTTEQNYTDALLSYINTGVNVGAEASSVTINYSGEPFVTWFFQRAPSFFDEVCYTGNATAGTTITHNLGVVPELIIVKNRTSALSWVVYSSPVGATKGLFLNLTNAPNTSTSYWNDTAPTSSVFTIGTSTLINENGSNFVAYLFATCAGVSKVGSYTGNGSTQTINCGFTGGARFVLIKRTDSTGDWYVWDTARGIISANDPHLSLNTTAAEVTTDDTIDPDSTGFIVNQVTATNVNVSSATYIYLAIA